MEYKCLVINNDLVYIKKDKDRIFKYKLNILYNQVNGKSIKTENTLANYFISLKLFNKYIIKLHNNIV